MSSGSTPECWVKGDPKDRCSAFSTQVRSQYAYSCAHQDYGYLGETWRSDERMYWSCRLGIPLKNLADALEAADVGNEIERLVPFKIGKTNFLMVEENGGTASCQYFSIVAQTSADWNEVWSLPELSSHLHCGFIKSPQILFDGHGFTLRLPQSYVNMREPLVFPPETWAYRWTGKAFKLLRAPRSYNPTLNKDKHP